MSATEAVLHVSNLNITLEHRVIIEDLSFRVMRGEVLTVLGPNGAGKTVLMRALLGSVAYEGSITWRNAKRIGYVPQRLPYIRDIPLNVDDFFGLKRNANINVRDMLHAVGLKEQIAKQPMGKLSSGQFQRILIAWALAGDPDVLLFDEPTTGIDISGEETVYGLLERLHRERNLTMLLVTHDLSVAHTLASNVLCLNKRPVCQGPPLTVLTAESLERLYGAPVKYHHHVDG